ncbi:hypothetical protein LPJ73_000324 [Coemansia sp. RSA 2703]|nr:hypothetical protein LPJ73_000324 [Coemansia sp. RSA 2703]
METDMDLSQLRQRQVGALSRALGHFVALKSSSEGWQPVDGPNPAALPGSDIDVHTSRKTLKPSLEVYRLTAAIPLDTETTRDTQGPFSSYLSELRDWQAVLECPGIRSRWNYFLESCTSLEMLDSTTSITHAKMRKPVAGCTKEFAHGRDLLMVETSLVDPTTAVYVAASLPTTEDDPAYMRESTGTKRAKSEIWAWCVEIVTPMAQDPGLLRRSPGATRQKAKKPAVCVQVTCFLHLELGSWRSYDHEACRAAANLIPALVAHLRLCGAPPRLARIGPAISIDRRDWQKASGLEDRPIWEIACSLTDQQGNTSASNGVQEQTIVARILAMPAATGDTDMALSSYLSSSLERKQGESAAALGTHGGGIVRDGEAVSLAATRAWLGNGIIEFVVDASRWMAEGHVVEISALVDGLAGARLREAIFRAQEAAPELFTARQREAINSAQTEDELCALLVRCLSIASLKSSRRRYLVRVVVPPPVLAIGANDSEAEDGASLDEQIVTNDRVRSVRITVRRSDSDENTLLEMPAAAPDILLVNGQPAEIVPFSLDPTEHRATVPTAVGPPRIATPVARKDRPTSVHSQPKQRAASIRSSRLETPVDLPLLAAVESSAVSTTPVALSEGEPLDIPLSRLRRIQQQSADTWTGIGTTDGCVLARNDPNVEKTGGQYVVRLETTIEGWTVFDVLGVILQMQRTGLWDTIETVSFDGPATATIQCSTKGTWATQARSARVCRTWVTDGRRRVEIAESTVEGNVKDGAINADVRLAAWVLETASVDGDFPKDGRARSASVATMMTDMAADVEAATQRKRQHAVRITRYLEYNPGGWLDSADTSVGAAIRKLGAATLAKDAVLDDTRIVRSMLETSGPSPSLVWTRNVHVVECASIENGLRLRYRLKNIERRGAAVELRIEHRVWVRLGGASSVEISVEPWTAECSLACFVDPDADPHATRVRIRHPHETLLPRADVMGTAWPTVSVTVVRGLASEQPSHAAAERPLWSVPPRVAVNTVRTRIRYLRRSDSDDSALYTRCASVSSRDASRMLRKSESVVIDDTTSFYGGGRDETSSATTAAKSFRRNSLASVAVLGYSAPETANSSTTTLVSAEDFVDIAARTFASVRHDISSDPTRHKWHQLRGRPQRQWSHRHTDLVDVFERQIDTVHDEIPVTVAMTVLQQTEMERMAELLIYNSDSVDVASALFGSRRSLETVTTGTTIEHVEMQVPFLCERRDALTVRRSELAPFMPARQRMRMWQTGVSSCGRRGDYDHPVLTIIEASVPRSQPLRSAIRAHVPLLAIRVEPIDGFERIASGNTVLQHPACRLFVACCVDLGGSMPLVLRRSWSARAPEQIIARVRQILAHRSPLPHLLAPLSAGRLACSGQAVAVEGVAACVDGRDLLFCRSLDRQLIVREQQQQGLQQSDGVYSVSVRCSPSASSLSAESQEAAGQSINENNNNSVSSHAAGLPVVADIHVPDEWLQQPVPTTKQGLSVTIEISTSLSSGILAPLAPVSAVACGEWLSSLIDPYAKVSRLAAYVFQDSNSGLLLRLALVQPQGESDGDDGGPDADGNLDDCVFTVTISRAASNAATAASGVTINGQPMRVHPIDLPSRSRALQYVETSDGRQIDACTQCAALGCQNADEPDYFSDDLSDDENPCPPPNEGRPPSVLSSVAAASTEAAALVGSTLGITAASDKPLLPDALSLRSVSSAKLCCPASPASQTISNALRQRRPIMLPGAQVAPAFTDQPDQPLQAASRESVDVELPDNCGYMVPRRVALVLSKVLALAVFMPVRRLVIGRQRRMTLGKYLEIAAMLSDRHRSSPGAVRKSTLCLLLLAITAVACVALGRLPQVALRRLMPAISAVPKSLDDDQLKKILEPQQQPSSKLTLPTKSELGTSSTQGIASLLNKISAANSGSSAAGTSGLPPALGRLLMNLSGSQGMLTSQELALLREADSSELLLETPEPASPASEHLFLTNDHESVGALDTASVDALASALRKTTTSSSTKTAQSPAAALKEHNDIEAELSDDDHVSTADMSAAERRREQNRRAQKKFRQKDKVRQKEVKWRAAQYEDLVESNKRFKRDIDSVTRERDLYRQILEQNGIKIGDDLKISSDFVASSSSSSSEPKSATLQNLGEAVGSKRSASLASSVTATSPMITPSASMMVPGMEQIAQDTFGTLGVPQGTAVSMNELINSLMYGGGVKADPMFGVKDTMSAHTAVEPTLIGFAGACSSLDTGIQQQQQSQLQQSPADSWYDMAIMNSASTGSDPLLVESPLIIDQHQMDSQFALQHQQQGLVDPMAFIDELLASPAFSTSSPNMPFADAAMALPISPPSSSLVRKRSFDETL